MESRWDFLGHEEFLCCNRSCCMQKHISHKKKGGGARWGKCPGEQRELKLLEFMRKEALGRRGTCKDQALNDFQGFFCGPSLCTNNWNFRVKQSLMVKTNPHVSLWLVYLIYEVFLVLFLFLRLFKSCASIVMLQIPSKIKSETCREAKKQKRLKPSLWPK